MSGLAAALQRRALAVLTVSQIIVGLALAATLHLRALDALDATLIGAAEAHAIPHNEPDQLVSAGGVRAIPVQLIDHGDTHPAVARVADARGASGPLLFTIGGVRYAMRDLDELGLPGGPHPVAVAWSPAITLAASAGPFAWMYALYAAIVTTLAAMALGPLLDGALAPLRHAADHLGRVATAGTGARVGTSGPPEIATLLRAVDALLDRLDRAFATQARFTAYAAHELRTPVAAMLGEAEVALRRDRDAATYREALTQIAATAADLGALVDGLVLLTRLDTGHVESQRDREHASGVATSAARTTEQALARADVALTITLRADPELTAHTALLSTALSNLLLNVSRHAPGARATLTVDATDQTASFTITDDGPGISAGVRDTIFDRYARGPSAAAGLGLGLSLAREIARRHGGDLVLHDVDVGTTLTLTVAR